MNCLWFHVLFHIVLPMNRYHVSYFVVCSSFISFPGCYLEEYMPFNWMFYVMNQTKSYIRYSTYKGPTFWSLEWMIINKKTTEVLVNWYTWKIIWIITKNYVGAILFRNVNWYKIIHENSYHWCFSNMVWKSVKVYSHQNW